MTDFRYYHITPGKKLVRLATLDEALAVKGGGFIWLDYCQPTNEDLSLLIEPLGLHHLAIEDCLDEEQIPKIEDYPQHTLMLFNAFNYSNETLTIHEVDLIIGENFLVTVSGQNPEKQPILKGIERVVELDIEIARQGPDFLAHVILNYIVDQKFVAIEALEDEMDANEDKILGDHSRFNPADLLNLRRELLSVRKSLFHEREILVKISRKDCPFISENAILFYRDIYDHLAKFFELTETYRDIVNSLMEMYLSLLNNQMTKAANDTNVTVRRLTLITTIFMPLTLLASIGGMSEWSMMTGPQNWRIAYPTFLLAMVILGFVNFLFLKWLEKKRGE